MTGAWRWFGLLLALVLHGMALAAPACPPPVQVAVGPAAAERDRGLLWRISRDGRTSYLYGTLHVGKPAWRRFGPQISAALKASDVLALEIDPADPALLEALSDIRSPEALPEPVRTRLLKAYERACLATEAMAALHPLLQASTLTVLEARWLGMDPAYASEALLSAQVRANGRKVVSLETVAQQKAALVPESSEEALALLEQTLAQLEDLSGRRVLERLARAWERGDLPALEDYDTWCQCVSTEAERAFMRKLNDERNPALADGIEAQHRAGKRVFAAVGALHMTGAAALPKLLAQRGFKVERIAFTR
ncbi:MAG: TraB/GumN family protein [Rubrivivax sp.]|nr:TraB/GumN family protein [Rubrivivax sp.]